MDLLAHLQKELTLVLGMNCCKSELSLRIWLCYPSRLLMLPHSDKVLPINSLFGFSPQDPTLIEALALSNKGNS